MEDSNLVLVHRRKLDWTQEEEDQGRMTELALLPSKGWLDDKRIEGGRLGLSSARREDTARFYFKEGFPGFFYFCYLEG